MDKKNLTMKSTPGIPTGIIPNNLFIDSIIPKDKIDEGKLNEVMSELGFDYIRLDDKNSVHSSTFDFLDMYVTTSSNGVSIGINAHDGNKFEKSDYLTTVTDMITEDNFLYKN